MNNVLSIFNENSCCGCGVCKLICPTKAIEMADNEKGFLHPIIDNNKCINCGLCANNCSFNNFKKTNKKPKSYLFQLLDEAEREMSQSGGAFYALANSIVENGGFVFGCELDDSLTAVHNCYSKIEDIKKFRGSKYVQSNLKDSYLKCESLLLKGKLVLFSGTPCQTHSLLAYLSYKKTNIDNLVTCDIVCHGCPSPEVFESYKKYLSNNKKQNLKDFVFRDKKIGGWHSHKEKAIFEDGSEYVGNDYAKLFYKHLLFDEKCFACPYTTIERGTDLTICDAWRTDRTTKDEFDDNKGTSIIMVHTEKGIRLLKSILECNIYSEIDISEYIQPQMISPVEKSKYYDSFWNTYSRNHFRAIKKFSSDNSLKHKIKALIKKTMRKVKNEI